MPAVPWADLSFGSGALWRGAGIEGRAAVAPGLAELCLDAGPGLLLGWFPVAVLLAAGVGPAFFWARSIVLASDLDFTPAPAAAPAAVAAFRIF